MTRENNLAQGEVSAWELEWERRHLRPQRHGGRVVGGEGGVDRLDGADGGEDGLGVEDHPEHAGGGGHQVGGVGHGRGGHGHLGAHGKPAEGVLEGVHEALEVRELQLLRAQCRRGLERLSIWHARGGE